MNGRIVEREVEIRIQVADSVARGLSAGRGRAVQEEYRKPRIPAKVPVENVSGGSIQVHHLTVGAGAAFESLIERHAALFLLVLLGRRSRRPAALRSRLAGPEKQAHRRQKNDRMSSSECSQGQILHMALICAAAISPRE